MYNMRKQILLTFLSLSAIPSQMIASSKDKTNFIIIFCDDLGYGDLGCFGHPSIKTPCLDRIAFEGQKWSSFYVSASVSSPSRSGLMTGRLGVNTGMYGNQRRVLFPNSPKGLPAEEQTIAFLLKKADYTTACVGKWHLGCDENSLPLKHGFDFFYGIPYSNDMSRYEQHKIGNLNYVSELPFYNQDMIIEYEPDQTKLTKRLTDYAVSFIQTHQDKPFFLYLAHPMPHVPLYTSADFQGKSARGRYGDAVEELDWSVGQIMDALAESGLDENTLVIFSSDNGPWVTWGIEGGSAGALKDGKGSTCEGGFRVPCIFWGKEFVQPGHITDMGSTLDILPTLSDIAGVTLPADREYDGVSLKHVLTDKKVSPRDQFCYYRGNNLFAIRKGDFKAHFLIQSAYGDKDIRQLDTPLLYNINEDIGERFDLAEQYPEKVKELIKLAKEQQEKTLIKQSIFDLPALKSDQLNRK